MKLEGVSDIPDHWPLILVVGITQINLLNWYWSLDLNSIPDQLAHSPLFLVIDRPSGWDTRLSSRLLGCDHLLLICFFRGEL